MGIKKIFLNSTTCTHTHADHIEEEGVAAEEMTKHARSQPFGTIWHHMVTKHAWVTKCVASASNLTCFVILVTFVTKHVGVTKCVASASNLTRFIILVTKHAGVTKYVASASNLTHFVILVTLVTKYAGVTKCGSATPVHLQRKLSVKGDPKQDRSWPEIHKVHKYFHV